MERFFDALTDAIEKLVRARKLRWLIAIPSAIGTILVIFGLAAKLAPLVNITLLCLSVFLGISVIVLAISRRALRWQVTRRNQILDHYGTRIFETQQKNPGYFHILKWDEHQVVGKGGDTVIVRDIGIKAGAVAVPAVWTRASRNSSAHLAGVKEKIRIEARFLNEDGELGTSLIVVPIWETDKTVRIQIYFDRDVEPDDEVLIRLTIKWPSYSADLLDGAACPNYWVFRRRVDSFTSKVTFTGGFAPMGVRLTPMKGSPAANARKNKADGSVAVSFTVPTVQQDKEYGYYVELIRPEDD